VNSPETEPAKAEPSPVRPKKLWEAILDLKWPWPLIERGLLALGIVMFFVTHIATSVIGEDYELSAWIEFPRVDTKAPRPPQQTVTLHVLNTGKPAIGNDRNRWFLDITPAPGTTLQYIDTAMVRKNAVVIAKPTDTGVTLETGLLPGRGEIGVRLDMASNSNQPPGLHSSLDGLPQPSMRDDSPFGDLIRVLFYLICPPAIVIFFWNTYKFNELKRQGLIRYTKRHPKAGEVVKPMTPGTLFVAATLASPVFATILAGPLALVTAYAIIRMFDWGLLD
jgi:hypothetical protein